MARNVAPGVLFLCLGLAVALEGPPLRRARVLKAVPGRTTGHTTLSVDLAHAEDLFGLGDAVETPHPAARALLQAGGADARTEEEAANTAAAAQAAPQRNNAAYHEEYKKAIDTLRDEAVKKGPRLNTTIPTDEVSMDGAKAYSTGTDRENDKDFADHKFRDMWSKREALIKILQRIAGQGPTTQTRFNKEYLRTQKELIALEAELGKPIDLIAQAAVEMKESLFGDGSPAHYARYAKAQADMKAAMALGPAINTGMFKKYIDRPGHSRRQIEDYHQMMTLELHNRKVKQGILKDHDAAKAAAIARFSYEADGGKRPGCAYIDGPCDHSEKDVPGAPLHPAASYVKPHGFTMSYQVPSSNRAFISGYRIMARPDGEGEWKKIGQATHGMQEINYAVDGLQANINYAVRVQATYIPLYIRKMSVYQLSQELRVHGVDSHNAEMQHDKPTLMMRLAAIEGEAAGPPSATIMVRTLMGKPAKMSAPPVILGWRPTPKSTYEVHLKWEAPNSEGARIRGYQIQYTVGGDTIAGWLPAVTNSGTNATMGWFDGFRPGGYMYQFKVAAINEKGVGRLSDVSDASATPASSRPDMVAQPTFDESYCAEGKCYFRLIWNTPPTGGEKILGYKILYQENGIGEWATKVGNTMSTETMFNMKDMKGGVRYNVKVLAKNKLGWSNSNSPYVTVATASGVPDAPSKPVFTNTTGTATTISWNAPPSNGAPITGYKIKMQTRGTGGYFTRIKNTKSTKTQIRITNLQTGGTGYEFKVIAVNKNGASPPSPHSDMCQTQYSSAAASKTAANEAMESFKINNNLNTITGLSAGYKLYKGEYKAALARIRLLKEELNSARNGVKSVRATSEINEKLLSTRQQIEREHTQEEVKIGDKLANMRFNTNMKSFELMHSNNEKLMQERVVAQREFYENQLVDKDKINDKLRDKIWKLNQEIIKEKHLRKMTQARARGPAVKGVDAEEKGEERELRESQSDDKPPVKKLSSTTTKKIAKKMVDSELEKMFDRAAGNAAKNAAFDHRRQEQKKMNAVESFLMHAPQDKNQHVAELGSQEVGQIELLVD